LPPEVPAEQVAAARAQAEIDEVRRELLPHIGEGGFAQAVCRVVLAGMVSIGTFERRSFRLARLLSDLRVVEGDQGNGLAAIDWRRLLREEARIAAVAPVEALNALGDMLPDPASRERALAVAAAVMMIEPTLANPRSEIIELLINTLGVEPERVMDLACRLTHPLGLAATPTPEVVKVKRPRPPRVPDGAARKPRPRAATSTRALRS
ncbi:MAG: poly(3-hydroxyalkanoate) synthetase, partial [Burkholderiaceae bacterium]|nr:poly(3-hydroxyalkanoate) synthetase [Burkholderiaceae bacterium]